VAGVGVAQTTLLQTLPEPAVRGSVFGVTIAAAGSAQLIGILTAGYLADQVAVYVLLADAPCYLLPGLVILRGCQRTWGTDSEELSLFRSAMSRRPVFWKLTVYRDGGCCHGATF